MENENRNSIEELLGYQDWIQSLAQGLVGKEESAADVVQDTWMTALERPPRDMSNLKGWLASVARHTLSQQRRGKARRRLREAQAKTAPELPSPEEILERESLRRLVVSELLALEPNFREVLLLKFYAGLPPRKIAESLEIPVETARTRTRRGMEALRRQLDRHFDDRKSWSVGVLAMAGIAAPGTSVLRVSVASKLSSILYGVLAVSPAVKLALTMGSLLVLFVAAWWWLIPDSEENLDPSPSAATLAKNNSAPGARRELDSQDLDDHSNEPALSGSAVGAGTKIQRFDNVAARVLIEGRITDENGRPISGAMVCAASAAEISETDLRSLYGSETMNRIRSGGHEYVRTESDDDGNYRLSADAFEGPASVIAWSKAHGVALAARRTLRPRSNAHRVDLSIETGLIVHGRVQDESGNPVPGAVIDCMFQVSATSMASGRYLKVDENGNFRSHRLCFTSVNLSARARGFETSSSKTVGMKGGPREVRLDFKMKSLAVLEGRILLSDGRSVAWEDLVALQFPGHPIGNYLMSNRVRVFSTYSSATNESQFLSQFHPSGTIDLEKASYRIQPDSRARFLTLAVGNRIVAKARLPKDGEAPDLIVDPSKMPVPVVMRDLAISVFGSENKKPVTDYVWFIKPMDSLDSQMNNWQAESKQSETLVKDIPLGRWQLDVTAEGWAKTTMVINVVSGSDPMGVVVSMAFANATIKGKVVNDSQKGLARAQVTLFDANGIPVEGTKGFRFLTDSEGNFECTELSAAPYTLAVAAEGYPCRAKSVLAKTGEKGTPVVIQLPTGIEVKMKFEGSSGPILPRVFDGDGRKLRDDVRIQSRFHGYQMPIILVENETYRIEFVSPGFNTAVVSFRATPGLVVPVVFEAK